MTHARKHKFNSRFSSWPPLDFHSPTAAKPCILYAH